MSDDEVERWLAGHEPRCGWQRHAVDEPPSCACGYLDRLARELTARPRGLRPDWVIVDEPLDLPEVEAPRQQGRAPLPAGWLAVGGIVHPGAARAALAHAEAVERVRRVITQGGDLGLAAAVAGAPGPYLVGGSRAALVLRDALDDPEVRAELTRRFAEVGRVISEWLNGMRPAIEAAARSMGSLVESMREAGMLPDEPPADPRARALWLRQHRSTGPSRPGPERSRPPRRTR